MDVSSVPANNVTLGVTINATASSDKKKSEPTDDDLLEAQDEQTRKEKQQKQAKQDQFNAVSDDKKAEAAAETLGFEFVQIKSSIREHLKSQMGLSPDTQLLQVKDDGTDDGVSISSLTAQVKEQKDSEENAKKEEEKKNE